MKGKVEEISRQISKKGDEYLRVTIDGEKYTIWEPDYFDLIKEGDIIDFEYTESTQWKNITDLAVACPTTDEGPERGKYLRLKDRQIARMSCLKSAAYLLANLEGDSSEKGQDTLSLAKIFERYIYEDDLSD
jgi:hypothetical protein